MSDGLTIAEQLTRGARDRSDGVALITPHDQLTLGQLEETSQTCARGLRGAGLEPGQRAVVMLRPGSDFLVVTFALFKMGAVPVFVDPGMGRSNLKVCLGEARPAAFIGTPVAQLARVALGWARRSIKLRVTAGPIPLGRGVTLNRVRSTGAGGDQVVTAAGFDDPAAIAFTSGSTGIPKGVVYTHRMFSSQVELLRDSFGIERGEIDLATFPLFALFDPALGATTVFPKMDFTRPASVDPRQILGPIREFGVTHMFGSPALLNHVSRYAVQNGERLGGVRRILSAGAPVATSVVRRLRGLLDEGSEVHTPYGATEALPVCSISDRQLLAQRESGTGRGVCVGRPLKGITLRVIPVDDGPFEQWDPNLVVASGEIGELVVGGDNVSQQYFERPDANRLSKMADGHRLLHRMGDVGYLDANGRVWICGRKSQRVITRTRTLFTVACEGVFNQHGSVFRTALVGLGKAGRQKPVICVELEKRVRASDKLRREILELGAADSQTADIETLLFHPSFPVDIRHNAKIFREKLAVWAEEQLE